MISNPQETKALTLHQLIVKKNNLDTFPLKKFLITKDDEDLLRTTLKKSGGNRASKPNKYSNLFAESDILLKPQEKNVSTVFVLLEFLHSFSALKNLSTSQYE